MEDTRSGIKEEDIPRLFNIFGRIYNSEIQGVNLTGVGLGLSISQDLVRLLNQGRHGEVIKVSSEWQKGSIFYFVLFPFTLEPKKLNSKSSINFIELKESYIDLNERARTPNTNFKIPLISIKSKKLIENHRFNTIEEILE